jgi:hypothetical protein
MAVFSKEEYNSSVTNSIPKVTVFWVVVPCSLVEVYRRFRDACCLHHQGSYSATTGKTVIFIMAATEPQIKMPLDLLMTNDEQ